MQAVLETDNLLSKLQDALQSKSLVDGGESASTAVGLVQSEGSWASIYGFVLPRDEQVALLLLQGRSRMNIAKEMGLSAPTIYRLVQTPIFKASFHTMQEEIRETTVNQQTRIELLCTVALDNIAHTLFNSQDEELKIKTSLAVLDRGGHSVKQQAVITQKFEVSEEAAALISRSMEELRQAKERRAEVITV